MKRKPHRDIMQNIKINFALTSLRSKSLVNRSLN